ncbi:phosphoribosylformylglycinamidine cyclo-ligase [Mycoplasmatota bacterium]|nr:phosphoribosylformylglycinamidine cyclo-ligase [Mycoplasmatota bacterium]
MSEVYKNSGVDIHKGYEVVKRIKNDVDKTKCLGTMGSIGGFGGLFDLSKLNIKEPVLVSGTDGVGTKLLLAIMLDKHDTIGEDLVAMCVNDVLTQGAKPLFFLDYVAVGKNEPEKIASIVKGVSNGCLKAGCALIGGETAEMPDVYEKDHYDLAGFTVGVVEKSKMITGEKCEVGDVLIGLTSSGIHSNGYSLVRKILLKDHHLDLNQQDEKLNQTLGEALLTPTKIYVKPVLEVLKNIDVHSMTHITGGGFDENIIRGLKSGYGVTIDCESFKTPEIFSLIERLGEIPKREMYQIFNMGIGFILMVSPNDVEETLRILKENNEEACVIGKVIKGEGVNLV